MGKVRDESPAKSVKAAPAPKGGTAARKAAGGVASYVGNLLRVDVVKPTQGRNARLLTALGLGALVLAGLYQLFQLHLVELPPVPRFAIPTALAAAFGWIIWRTVQYPPFADFLIATEAEMNKVSWTSRDDLYRATLVVLATVFFLALYLFGVDYLWSALLQFLGVLKFNGESLGNS